MSGDNGGEPPFGNNLSGDKQSGPNCGERVSPESHLGCGEGRVFEMRDARASPHRTSAERFRNAVNDRIGIKPD